jgi:hypothetical protein
VFWDKVSFYVWADLTTVLLFVHPYISGMTGMYCHSQPLVMMGSWELFFLGCPLYMISTSLSSWIIDVSLELISLER